MSLRQFIRGVCALPEFVALAESAVNDYDPQGWRSRATDLEREQHAWEREIKSLALERDLLRAQLETECAAVSDRDKIIASMGEQYAALRSQFDAVTRWRKRSEERPTVDHPTAVVLCRPSHGVICPRDACDLEKDDEWRYIDPPEAKEEP